MEERQIDDGWIEHDGSECPVADDVTVELRNTKGWLITAPSHMVKWENVVAYRVVR